MPTIEQMRNEVVALYKSNSWARRVNRMSDSQVTAIYMKQIADSNKPKTEPDDGSPSSDIPF